MTTTVDVAAWLDKVRQERPLVHNITNLVVTNVAANGLLAIGASPVMAYAKQEVADMARIAGALALNMGTLDEDVVEAMRIAGQAANAAGVPVVFDPVGVGATPYRNEVAERLTEELKLAILRGNAGEIGVLLGAGGEVKGVDSQGAASGLPEAMRRYAGERGCCVIATGPTDYVTDGKRVWALSNGHPLMAAITGSGCVATAILGAFAAAAGRGQDATAYAEAAVAALTCYNVAGELAADKAQGPGTFQAALFDALYHLDGEYVGEVAKIEVLPV
ncbi:MAG: hydroxyethylthiazole kinase [Alicyclobacillus macrosporangiidus]|uniref:hydroxyethylthiazole kinase n=1 Tax=Alicyclobacillus macrosporangiidus TaxID=392015 RepID=UPI0026EFE3F3|nr:hydroxyethylthiazole kinase [Alicyclobacillus macrosporangiidus]MCL6598046.1 hydroxyethylthiazole kinase [Alicyclobacillus macrosporangiidus]